MEKATVALIIATLALISNFTNIGLTDKEPTHYCESRELKAYCFDLSSTLKTCYTLPAKTGGKRCTETWKEIPLIPIIEYQDYTTNKGDWICPPRPNKCIKVER